MKEGDKICHALRQAQQRFADVLSIELTLTTARQELEEALKAVRASCYAAHREYSQDGIPTEQSVADLEALQEEFQALTKLTWGHFDPLDENVYTRIFSG